MLKKSTRAKKFHKGALSTVPPYFAKWQPLRLESCNALLRRKLRNTASRKRLNALYFSVLMGGITERGHLLAPNADSLCSVERGFCPFIAKNQLTAYYNIHRRPCQCRKMQDSVLLKALSFRTCPHFIFRFRVLNISLFSLPFLL